MSRLVALIGLLTITICFGIVACGGDPETRPAQTTTPKQPRSPHIYQVQNSSGDLIDCAVYTIGRTGNESVAISCDWGNPR